MLSCRALSRLRIGIRFQERRLAQPVGGELGEILERRIVDRLQPPVDLELGSERRAS